VSTHLIPAPKNTLISFAKPFELASSLIDLQPFLPFKREKGRTTQKQTNKQTNQN